MDCITINYSNLCNNTNKNLLRIGRFLDIDYKQYSDMIKLSKQHIPSGNKGTLKSFMSFNGLRVDTSWKKRLKSWQKQVLDVVS